MKNFNTRGRITFDFDIDIDAETEEEAEIIAIQMVKDYYHLNVRGAYHDKDDVKVDNLDTGEYEGEYEEGNGRN